MKKFFRYIAFAIAAGLMILIFPMTGKFNYHYQKGSPWIYETLIADVDFPILKTEAEILREKEKKASQVIDCYTFSEEVARLNEVTFEDASSENDFDSTFVAVFTGILSKVGETGLVTSFDEGDIYEKVIFINRDKRIKECPAGDVYTIDQAISELKFALYEKMSIPAADSIIKVCKPETYLTPNLIFDNTTTQLFHQEAVNFISPTKGIIYKGQLIVSKGELVTTDIEQMLDSYKAEYEKSYGIEGSRFSLIVSHCIFVILQLSLLAVCLYFMDRRVLNSFNKLAFILVLLVISFAATAILSGIGNGSWALIFPYAAIALYLFSFFDNRTAFPVYIIVILPILVICEEGAALFFINLAAGTVALTASYSFNRGWKQFLSALLIFIAEFAVYTSFQLASNSGDMIFMGKEITLMAVSSVLVVMFYPFAYLFEKVFSLISHSRLWELSDTNSTLLREMARLAPGTFQHSMQVANLAEEATRQVGGYAMLARVGALYHDIGKMENPLCFIENRIPGSNADYHKELAPETSAHDIIRHVEDGMALARKHSLPEVVSDFIRTHHGDTLVRYFYTTYCNNGGNPDDVEKFKYNGMLPQTKEQVILMIADSIEAASRTLKDYNTESISNLVDNIVDSKMEERQFSKADITLKEIDIAKESFKTYLLQIYHARISYPKRKKTETQ